MKVYKASPTHSRMRNEKIMLNFTLTLVSSWGFSLDSKISSFSAKVKVWEKTEKKSEAVHGDVAERKTNYKLFNNALVKLLKYENLSIEFTKMFYTSVFLMKIQISS